MALDAVFAVAQPIRYNESAAFADAHVHNGLVPAWNHAGETCRELVGTFIFVAVIERCPVDEGASVFHADDVAALGLVRPLPGVVTR